MAGDQHDVPRLYNIFLLIKIQGPWVICVNIFSDFLSTTVSLGTSLTQRDVNTGSVAEIVSIAVNGGQSSSAFLYCVYA